ncbi:aminoacyl-tRNA hydrolase [Ectothiorhodospiraceae bacterium 2226]|nr:aminoacyl-tRNA hydrolase [Ectothiorhodospiraceae bacterium 2226]
MRPELIVGLGNPGPTYFETRHNAGFWFVDALARLHGASFKSESRFQGEVARLDGPEGPVWLLKPQTFMNHSGRAVGPLARFYKIAPEAVLVAHDELDLQPGQVRLKQGGGHGGHNGLRDTVAQLGTNAFARLRIGIGHPGPGNDVVGYVLGKPPAAERELIIEGLAEALECMPMLLAGESQKVMQRLHTRN